MRRTFIDSEHEAGFRRDGFLLVDELLEPSEVQRLLAGYAPFHEQHANAFGATALLRDREVRRQVHRVVSESLQARVLPLMDDYRLVLASFAVKRPVGGQSEVALHQDLSFVDERQATGVSVWCPLTDVNVDNGCIGVVRGSHVLNDNFREPGPLAYAPELVRAIARDFLSYVPMRAGQALFVDNRVFHGSPPNQTDQIRIVAGAVAVPSTSRLLYCHRDLERAADRLEVWEVPSDFYLRHNIGERPQEGGHVATVARVVAALTEEQVRARCQPGPAHSSRVARDDR